MDIIRVPVTQVPQFWEVIKFASVHSDNINEDVLQGYCNTLLVKLLTGKLQAVIKIDDARNVEAIIIMGFEVSNLSGAKSLVFYNFYSWKSNSLAEWKNAFMSLLVFAKAENCKKIIAHTYNPRLWQMAESAGFKETSRQYVLDV